ncbi:MAG TPA: MFS transporter [Gammaproteobacteria bacterium]|nr:MFS transporter [Gammaproteobacteria bacterium]HBK13576.1 MFS transporter [Gammaproteobacteria bacterium]
MTLQPYRTLIVLLAAQCFGQTAAPILVLLGGLIGAQIAPSANLMTLPLAFMIIGTAATTAPASMLMARVGRKIGFLFGSGLAVFASLLAALGVYQQSFAVFCLAAFLIGSYLAFLQQYRFAVAESVAPDAVPKSLSILMLAGIVAALLGPEVGRRFSSVDGLPDFVGSFLGLAVMMAMSFFILLLFFRDTEIQADTSAGDERPLGLVLRQPTVILAIASAVVGYTIMSLIMTATPVSMHELDQHSLDATTWVVQSHILAMYIPSFFSGFLISRFGVLRIIQCGFLLMLICVVVGWGRPELMHYFGSMVLLGVGWNFLFLGGTTLLTQSYRMSERFKVQATNDFMIFGLQAVGSLGAGMLLATLGWNGVLAFSLPWLLVLIPVLIYAKKHLSVPQS